jgi:hypothetical protein
MRVLRSVLLTGAVLSAWSPAASGHVVYERTSLRQWLQQSSAAAVVRIESGPEVWVSADGRQRRDFFGATRLEALRGTPTPERFDFVPHAEGLPGWNPGDRVLLFLERSNEHRERVGAAPRFEWMSTQNPRSAWAVPERDPESEEVVRMARRWARWLDAPETDLAQRAVSLRGLILTELRSPSERLQIDALRELIRAQEQPALFPTADATAPFAQLAATRHLDVSHRATLGRLLSERPGFDASSHWKRLLADLDSDEERRAVIRKLADVDDPDVRAWMQSQLESPNAALRSEAAHALGRLGPERPIAALAKAAADPDDKVARAAIRALGSGPEPEARAALETLAAREDARADWAKAELRRDAGKSASP